MQSEKSLIAFFVIVYVSVICFLGTSFAENSSAKRGFKKIGYGVQSVPLQMRKHNHKLPFGLGFLTGAVAGTAKMVGYTASGVTEIAKSTVS